MTDRNRKLDELIAKHVFKGVCEQDDGPIGQLWRMELPGEGIATFVLPHFSTEISSAWLLVERIKETNSFGIEYQHNYGVNKRTGWSVQIGGREVAEFCESPCEAICVGVLKHFGVKFDIWGPLEA